jgi:hypothetical protein
MKLYDKILQLKRQGYTRAKVLEWAKDLYDRRGKPWSNVAQKTFTEAWATPILSYEISDVLPEVDLPKDLKKLTDFQRNQIINYLEHRDKVDVARRYRQSGVLINLAAAKGNKKLLEQGKILSNLIYEVILSQKK